MPTVHQKRFLQALMLAFLTPTTSSLPEHNPLASASSLSRFLNHYAWPTRQLVQLTRETVTAWLLSSPARGKRPTLRVLVDLTCLEKTGRFAQLTGWLHFLNGKSGVQLVVLYLELGEVRVPWGFRVWRGKGTTSASNLALRLLSTLSEVLTKRYRVLVLANPVSASCDFLEGVVALGYHALTGVRKNRLRQDGGSLADMQRRGQKVMLKDLKIPVWVSWFYLKEPDGTRDKRFIISTQALSGSYLVQLGRSRWHIEGLFKTLKGMFAFARFGQSTKRGVLRWLILSLLAFILAYAAHLTQNADKQPRWAAAAQQALIALLPNLVLIVLLAQLERHRRLFPGYDLNVDIKCSVRQLG